MKRDSAVVNAQTLGKLDSHPAAIRPIETF
jgi:hypothetical protein